MRKIALVAVSVVGVVAIIGTSVGLTAVVLNHSAANNSSVEALGFEGGRGGGGATGGPQPGDDYPAYLKNAKQDTIFDHFGEYNRECVSFVATAMFQRFGYSLPWVKAKNGGGNAKDWAGWASEYRIPVDTNATVTSVAWRGSGKFGHVALVVAVSGDILTVEQYNNDKDKNGNLTGSYSWQTLPKSSFDKFIHFVPAPATPATPVQAPPAAAQIPAPTLTVVAQPQGGGQLQVTNPQGGNVNPQSGTGNPQSGTTNPQNSGSARLTPVQPPAASAPVANPAPQAPALPPSYAETVGGPTHTWTNYTNAGGTAGPTISTGTTVQIACKVQGFKVADGNTWWYRIASSPWNGTFYASADAFYNNGSTSGSLRGTPFVDPNVRDC